MDRERKKAMIVVGAATAAPLVGVGPLAPLVVPLAKVGVDAASKTIQKRVEQLLVHAAKDDDPEVWTSRVNRAFLEEDQTVITAFIQSVRAVMEALSPAAVPSIGLLFRRAIATEEGKLPRWQERRYLRLLEEVNDVEFGDARDFAHGVLNAPALLEEPARQSVPVISLGRHGAARGDEIVTDLNGASPNDRRRLCTVQDARRLFSLLRSHQLASETEDGISVDLELMRPLAEIMPLPSHHEPTGSS